MPIEIKINLNLPNQVQIALDWMLDKVIEKLEREGVLCERKWALLYAEDTVWIDTANDYIDTIEKKKQEEIICEVGITNTMKYIFANTAGDVLSRINNYEGFLCAYALNKVVEENIEKMHYYYLKKIRANPNDSHCKCFDSGTDSDEE